MGSSKNGLHERFEFSDAAASRLLDYPRPTEVEEGR